MQSSRRAAGRRVQAVARGWSSPAAHRPRRWRCPPVTGAVSHRRRQSRGSAPARVSPRTYNPGGCWSDTFTLSISAAAMGCAVPSGETRSPSPSSRGVAQRLRAYRTGGSNGLRRIEPATRLIISTNKPESGRFDQLALAVTWKRTTRPLPLASAVTSGVPSARLAQVLPARSLSGSASTWRVTVIRGSMVRPAKGDVRGNSCRVCGVSHESALPRVRSPSRRRTGIRSS